MSHNLCTVLLVCVSSTVSSSHHRPLQATADLVTRASILADVAHGLMHMHCHGYDQEGEGEKGSFG